MEKNSIIDITYLERSIDTTKVGERLKSIFCTAVEINPPFLPHINRKAFTPLYAASCFFISPDTSQHFTTFHKHSNTSLFDVGEGNQKVRQDT